ncbi:RAMP superfamily CRISPR-associated protein [Candidatus Chlorohelix sp.]|uniref:RAMP superfamily CRISPR-associated protein n=1 Tax=Candidatus Chlorohelix sp. TaxID=3139201 RepID=UPI003049D305
MRKAHALLEAGDNTFVRTTLDGTGRETIFLPGSSLRGMLRSQSERIARTLSFDRAKPIGKPYPELHEYNYDAYTNYVAACDPLAMEGDETEPDETPYAAIACTNYMKSVMPEWLKQQNRQRAEERSEFLYQKITECSCPACLLFGNTYLAGRLKVNDAYSIESKGVDPRGETRQRLDFVAINRFTGGVRDSAKFEAHPHFHTTNQKLRFRANLTLTDLNLPKEGWMLGWLAYLLRDLYLGDLRLGLGKAKGLGKACGKLVKIRVGSLQPDLDWLNLSEGWQEETEQPGLLRVFALDLNGSSTFEHEKQLLNRYAAQYDELVDKYSRVRAGQER